MSTVTDKRMSYTKFADEFCEDHSSSIEFEEEETKHVAAFIPLQEMAQNFGGPDAAGVEQINMDFLTNIAPPVITEPQAFTDLMLDPNSRNLMTSITTKHMSGTTLQRTLRQSADQLQRTLQGQFVSLKGNMSYRELLAGLIHEGEIFQAMNHFTFLNYSHIVFCDETNRVLSQKTGGICLLTNKRLLFLSSQLSVNTSLKEWGKPKELPGGYSIDSSCNDTTYYLPIPLRSVRSVEMTGQTGVSGQISVHGVAPSCCGLCGLCGVWCQNDDLLKKWLPQQMIRTQVQDMKVSLGVLMPPWEHRMFVHIHIDTSVPLRVTRDFVALLQKNSLNLN